MSDFKKDFA